MEENNNVRTFKPNIIECCFMSVPKKYRRVIWELTHYCPQYCSYCFTSSNKEITINRGFLGKNKIKFINLFENLNVKDVLLTGGEPLSFENELIDIIKILGQKRMTYSISTTGRPKKYFEKVCNLNPRRVNLSFDPKSKDGSLHWKSSRNILEQSLKILSKNNIPTKLTAVLTKKNLRNIPDFIRILDEICSKYDIEKIALTNEYRIGRGIYEPGLCLDELENIYRVLKPELSNISSKIVLINWPSFNDVLQSCPAGHSLFSVMPNGDITPCSLLSYLLSTFKIGNIRQDLKKIEELLLIFHEEALKFIQELKSNKICQKCRNREMCGGGCLALLLSQQERLVCKFQPELIIDNENLDLQMLKNFQIELYNSYKHTKI